MIILCMGKDEFPEITTLPQDLLHGGPFDPPAVEPEPLVRFFPDGGGYPRMHGVAETPDGARSPAV